MSDEKTAERIPTDRELIEELSRREMELSSQLEAARAETREIVQRSERALSGAVEREKETRAQFNDLKQRVHDLEIENATMLGYLNRVQEDDEVREELITVGEPGGEQHLTPKRKPRLNRMYTSAPTALYDTERVREPWRERPKSKHWVNY
jgi:hypothetical protein